jgi:hypothetical protein
MKKKLILDNYFFLFKYIEGNSLIVVSEKSFLAVGGFDSNKEIIYNNLYLYDISAYSWKKVGNSL